MLHRAKLMHRNLLRGVIAVATALFAAAGATPATAASPTQDASTPAVQDVEPVRVLVFSKTAGFRHGSIEDGVKAIIDLGKENGFEVAHTEDADAFTADNLAQFDAVVFLSTTGNVLNETQEHAFQQYIESGGGYVGVHAAADTEYDWAWYGTLVGAYFLGHPRVQLAEIAVLNREHPATAHLDDTWSRTDEWYDYRARPAEDVTILMQLDESSYEGGSMGRSHPIAWCHEVGKGRAFYTGLGHTNESFREPEFLQHLLGAIRWAAGCTLESASASPTAAGNQADDGR